MPGYGHLRPSEFGITGLIRYGLHSELGSSDSDDSDYEPGDQLYVSSGNNSEENNLTLAASSKRKRKKSATAQVEHTTIHQVISVSNGTGLASNAVGIPSTTQICSTLVQVAAACRHSFTGKRKRRKIHSSNYIKTRSWKRELGTSQDVTKHDSPPNSDTWSELPMEILTHIFSYVTNFEFGARYLCRCAQVSRNWNVAVGQSVSWQGTIDLSFLGISDHANDSLLEKLTDERFSEITGLILSGWVNLTDAGLQSIAANCYKLQYLNISNCQKKVLSKITGDVIVELAESTPLKRVNFSKLRVSKRYSSSIIKFFKIRACHLTHINLSENISIGSAVLASICNYCPNIQVLDLSNTSVRSICFGTLQMCCTSLKELYLTNLCVEACFTKCESHSENPGFPHLEIISIALFTQYGPYTDANLQSVLKTSGKLTTLDIRGNRNVTHEGFRIMASKVERLCMARMCISIEMIDRICNKWSNSLWYLDLSWTETYGTQFDVLVHHLCASSNPCGKLTFLNLSGTPITDEGVKLILKTCHDLKYLDLTSCRGVSRGHKRLHDSLNAIQSLSAFYKL